MAAAQVQPQPGGRIRAEDRMDDYIRYSMALADVPTGSLGGASVFHDYLFGAAGREMMLAFERAGANLTPLHYAADGAFPAGGSEPGQAGRDRDRARSPSGRRLPHGACSSMATATASTSTGATGPISRPASCTPRSCLKFASGFPAPEWASSPT